AGEASAPLERVTLASLPHSKDVALERDALMAFLQYGHRLDQEILTRVMGLTFRHPALEAVRAAVAAHVQDAARAGWALDAIQDIREPYRALGGELLAANFPARDEDGAVASASSLARGLLIRALDMEKAELLGAVQRVPAESDQGRALRVRLRDVDAERRRLTDA
ncbi:MAG: DNA primase, partial [Lentisphaerae bacterium]|nr:DNA primase [Lentisphaerota bacterium]